ncbi:MAG: hypothetical protein NT062_17685 [Proteobacteria bacterium]|nr:hypothetical protein [Pseudomonadota bacterium]
MTSRLGWLVLVAGVMTGCYNPPKPACGFFCGPGGACPASYTCNAIDQRCHANGSPSDLVCSTLDAPLADVLPVVDGKVDGMIDGMIDAMPDASADAMPDARPLDAMPDAMPDAMVDARPLDATPDASADAMPDAI